MNSKLAVHILKKLSELQVREICFCPGSRNAPILAAFTENSEKFEVLYFFEERSAAFFALGRIRKTGRPVAVVTTSGTAAGELLPATMEAHYAGLPLILITADRPRSYRGSGAPQSAEQVNLYGPYVSHSLDIAGEESPEFLDFSMSRPYHVNLCFDEPLLEPITSDRNPYRFSSNLSESITFGNLPFKNLRSNAISFFENEIKRFLKNTICPLVVVGGLHSSERAGVKALLLKWKVPVLLEGLSGLREDQELQPYRVHLSDGLLERAVRANYLIDGLVRIGGIPTLRLWRDLEAKLAHWNVLSISRLPFSGLGRNSQILQGEVSSICEIFASQVEFYPFSLKAKKFLEIDAEAEIQVRKLLEMEPYSEPALIAALSERIPLGSRVYIGNSLPIREWDLAATRMNRNCEVWASRGVNGIDGQVSTFLGFAGENTENWMIIGDLTALYDLPGPWILSQLPKFSANMVVVNNGGGKIFSRMYSQKEFQNCHHLRFRSWADLWGLPFEEWKKVPEQIESENRQRVIEIIPDEEATQRFWKKFQTI